jgi:hypothetical protein
MGTATNIEATAVNTIAWLSAADTTIVVPVYQRQYRWDIGACEQLLADIRAVADATHTGAETGADTGRPHMHFIGSILSSASTEPSPGTERAASELVLIDGQQRITTLMLLIAALHHSVLTDSALAADPALSADLEKVLVSQADRARTKLRPHRAWAEIFESVVLGGRLPDADFHDSRFDDNYAFFRSQVPASEVVRIWTGLQRLEHVAITLGADANAQQIFESLNSTGEPLRDHELIHNYVLMGMSHAEQSEIEDTYWVPIEQNTDDAIAGFWRHYLVLTTGREVDATDGRSVYDAFRQRFPRLDLESLRRHAAEWRGYSEIYRILLHPKLADDAEVSRQLAFTNTFGRGMYPLVMRAYREYARGDAKASTLIGTLKFIQSLLLRRTIVGLDNDRLVGRLCRAGESGADALTAAIARITPSDARIRVALKYGDLPHARYVLGRLAGADGTLKLDGGPELDVDNIFPLAPADTWSGDGIRAWADYSDDEQNSHRALAATLGNLALVEASSAERALGASFPAKRALYAMSAIPETRALTDVPAWGTAAIAERTTELTVDFLAFWARPVAVGIDDDGLTPILDAQRRRGWPRGWQREFEYVEYRGEHWEVYDVKSLFTRIFTRLWADARADVVAFSARRGGPIFDAQAWNGQWYPLDDSHFLYLGWDSKYMLTAVQGALAESGIAAEVFVKYSYSGALM